MTQPDGTTPHGAPQQAGSPHGGAPHGPPSHDGSSPAVVVIGAGPAGIRAVECLVEAGLRPILIDEAPQAGGQIYRRPPAALQRPYRSLYGFEARKAKRLHDTLERLLPHIDYRPGTLAWDIHGNVLSIVSDGQPDSLPFDRLILSTGAMDRTLPLPGWLTPGVYTLGAAQIALKAQARAVGDPVVFLGCGPLLYLVAYQYAKAGIQVAAVLDTSPSQARWRALPSLLAKPDVLLKGAYYVAWLRAHGIPLRQGVTPLEIQGQAQVESITWSDRRGRHCTPATAVAYGFGLRSECQLAELAGCELAFDKINRQWLPRRLPGGRSSQPGVYLAGDGAGILGADAAEDAGRLAAWSVLQDTGHAAPPAELARLERALSRQRRFRQGLETAFPFPSHLLQHCPPDLVLCRCEEISVGQFLDGIQRLDAIELNRAKAFTRVGMGRCQGRVCGAAAADILAHACQAPVQGAGRMRAQAPVKPLFLQPLPDTPPDAGDALR